MNELQIRLTADIQGLQSALAKAKQTLKSFETETATDSEKSNVGFRRKIGLIEQLTAKARQLKVSLAQATNEQQIASFNAELEQTNIELARLNALGKNFSAPAVRSFDNLKRASGAATASAISFGRIIQDAPFGIIGVANNIQNFGEQFAALGGKATTAGQKLSMFFSALIQPANLAILAVSAVTAAWQAYSLGLFDAKEATDEVKDSIEAYRKSLTESQSSQLEGIKNSNDEIITLNSLRGIIEDETLERSKRLKAIDKANEIYPDLFKNLTTESVLAGKVGDAYEKATRLLIAKATAESDIQKVVSLNDEQKILGNIIGKNQKNVEILNQILQIEERVNRFRKEGQEELAIANENSIRYLKNQNPEIARILEIESEREILTKSISDNLKIALDASTKTTVEGEKLNRVFDENILYLERFGNEADKNKQKIDALGESLIGSLETQQKRLFREVRELRQNPISFVNAANLVFAEQKLKAIDEIIGPLERQFKDIEIDIDPTKLEGLESPTTKEIQDPGIIEGLQKQIASFEKLKQVTSDPTMLALYTLQIDLLKNKLAEFNGEEVKSNLQLIADAFGSMGQQIANSLNISNRSLRGFVTTLVSATPKIVAAILAKSKATVAGAKTENLANAQLAAGNSVVVATEGAKGLGPVGLALLPVFIAGALALVSSAFGKAGGGGGSASPGQGSTFTNRREFGGPVSKGRAYIVGEKRPELFVPNTNGIIVPQVPSMDYSGASVNPSVFGVDVRLKGPDDLLFFVEQAQIRRGIR
jgi:hypothetical protein